VLAVFHLDDPALGVPRAWARGVGSEPIARPPGLAAGFPNPFVESIELQFTLAQRGPVSLEVFDLSGRRVRTLHRGELGAGAHRVAWDGRADSGDRVPVGVYFVRLAGSDLEGTRSVVRIE
jgi:hypothetical protein